jgi:hypothetical protein
MFVHEVVEGAERLAAVLDDIATVTDRELLVSLTRLHHRFGAALSAAQERFERAGLHDLDGATSMPAWLVAEAGSSRRQATARLRTARRLRDLPVTRAAWLSGVLPEAHVEAIAAALTADTVDQWAEHEEALVPVVARVAAVDARRVMDEWAARAEALIERPPTEPRTQTATITKHSDGTWHLQATLRPDDGRLVNDTLRALTTLDSPAEPPRCATERRADALVDAFHRVATWGDHPTGQRRLPLTHLMMNEPDLDADHPVAVTIDGHPVTGGVLDEILCDAHTVRTTVRHGILTDLDATTRHIPNRLRIALAARDRHCRFPGCDRPATWCDAHHVTHWRHHGPTRLDNLVLLCEHHHQVIHRPGWTAALTADATFEVTNPTGRTWHTHPPGRLPLTG